MHSRRLLEFQFRRKSRVTLTRNHEIDTISFLMIESSTNVSGLPICELFEDVEGRFLLCHFRLIRHVCSPFLLKLPFRAMALDRQENMQRQKENWGRPSGGTDFVVDAGSMCVWQSAIIDRRGFEERRKRIEMKPGMSKFS